ncbi:hypothetical protein GQ457_09G022140 [Hibiscus cannabinus]
MDKTNQAKGKSTTRNETNVQELLDSEGSDYCPSEHEDSASEFFDSDNNDCDAADEVSDGHMTGSVLESLGYHPTNIGYNSDDGDSDSDDDVDSLHSLSSENSGSRKTNRFPEFNTEMDMKTPVLKNKLLFASKEILKEAVRQYGRVQRFNISFKKNDKKRLQTDLNYAPKSLQQDVKEATGGYVCKTKCTRARKLAIEKVLGSYKEQYTKIYEYLGEVRHSNPGGYVCLEGCKLGFKNHCRPFISIDGCFLKGYYQGNILAAVGIDANDCIYPIVVAAVEAETQDSWCWFLQLLTEDLGIVNSHHVTFMSDKQKGLIESLLDLFSYAEKRKCVRHLYSNFKNDGGYKGKALKDALWKAARTTTVRDYEKAMAEMRKISEGAHNWLQSKDPVTWSKSHFSTHSKCDILLNNYSECFNKMIIDARDKLILTMMEIIRKKMMQRISKKAEAAQKYTGLLCPKIQKKVDTLIEQAARCWPSHAGALRYEVAFGPSDQHVVDLEAGVCSCRKWDLTGIPCAHAISAMLSIQRRPENYVDSCYHRTTQINLYSNYIFPIRGANQWEQVPEMESLPILPPIQRRPTGRPKKKRRKAADEQDNGPSRGHRTLEIKCSKCGKPRHNIRSCRGQVRGNSRLNIHLSSATPAPSPEPSSSTVAPPVTAPPTFSTVVPPTTAPLTRIIPKLPFKRPAQTIQVPSHSTPTIQRRKIKVTAGRQFSQVQPTQHQPTPYQVVRWMMQSTPCDNVLPNSQESTGSFKPKNN